MLIELWLQNLSTKQINLLIETCEQLKQNESTEKIDVLIEP